ncbi:hypothetical protein EJ06DRAFT_523085 [Trichodelitschia bisporula]|uniref:Uncharacterized protein n=1 Tax=Trichodelitschia bisporula TaxID=703511 RepID=A0A6G1HSL5_9PEZI|nr:hypothetical protein EJ06DRAFT_523085 [Trichodelitschia bisporula]
MASEAPTLAEDHTTDAMDGSMHPSSDNSYLPDDDMQVLHRTSTEKKAATNDTALNIPGLIRPPSSSHTVQNFKFTKPSGKAPVLDRVKGRGDAPIAAPRSTTESATPKQQLPPTKQHKSVLLPTQSSSDVPVPLPADPSATASNQQEEDDIVNIFREPESPSGRHTAPKVSHVSSQQPASSAPRQSHVHPQPAQMSRPVRASAQVARAESRTPREHAAKVKKSARVAPAPAPPPTVDQVCELLTWTLKQESQKQHERMQHEQLRMSQLEQCITTLRVQHLEIHNELAEEKQNRIAEAAQSADTIRIHDMKALDAQRRADALAKTLEENKALISGLQQQVSLLDQQFIQTESERKRLEGELASSIITTKFESEKRVAEMQSKIEILESDKKHLEERVDESRTQEKAHWAALQEQLTRQATRVDDFHNLMCNRLDGIQGPPIAPEVLAEVRFLASQLPEYFRLSRKAEAEDMTQVIAKVEQSLSEQLTALSNGLSPASMAHVLQPLFDELRAYRAAQEAATETLQQVSPLRQEKAALAQQCENLRVELSEARNALQTSEEKLHALELTKQGHASMVTELQTRLNAATEADTKEVEDLRAAVKSLKEDVKRSSESAIAAAKERDAIKEKASFTLTMQRRDADKKREELREQANKLRQEDRMELENKLFQADKKYKDLIKSFEKLQEELVSEKRSFEKELTKGADEEAEKIRQQQALDAAAAKKDQVFKLEKEKLLADAEAKHKTELANQEKRLKEKLLAETEAKHKTELANQEKRLKEAAERELQRVKSTLQGRTSERRAEHTSLRKLLEADTNRAVDKTPQPPAFHSPLNGTFPGHNFHPVQPAIPRFAEIHTPAGGGRRVHSLTSSELSDPPSSPSVSRRSASVVRQGVMNNPFSADDKSKVADGLVDFSSFLDTSSAVTTAGADAVGRDIPYKTVRELRKPITSNALVYARSHTLAQVQPQAVTSTPPRAVAIKEPQRTQTRTLKDQLSPEVGGSMKRAIAGFLSEVPNNTRVPTKRSSPRPDPSATPRPVKKARIDKAAIAVGEGSEVQADKQDAQTELSGSQPLLATTSAHFKPPPPLRASSPLPSRAKSSLATAAAPAGRGKRRESKGERYRMRFAQELGRA